VSPARRDFLPAWNIFCPPDDTWVLSLILAVVSLVTCVLELKLHQLRVLLRRQFHSSLSILIEFHQRGMSSLRAVIQILAGLCLGLFLSYWFKKIKVS
jgi:hypothetical protein